MTMINQGKMSIFCHRCGTEIPLIQSSLIEKGQSIEKAYGICKDCCIVMEMTEIDGNVGWDKKKTYHGNEAFDIMARLISQLTGE